MNAQAVKMDEPQSTMYVMLQVDEPYSAREGSSNVYLRLSINGNVQHDIPAKRVEGLHDTFMVAANVPRGKNVALIQIVKIGPNSLYSARGLEVAPNNHIVDIDCDTLLHVKWRTELKKMVLSGGKQLMFILQAPDSGAVTLRGSLKHLGKWSENTEHKNTLQIPQTGSLVVVPVEPAEEAVEFKMQREMVCCGTEDVEMENPVCKKVQLSMCECTDILVSKWNETNVHKTVLPLSTKGYKVKQKDVNMLAILKGTSEMYSERNAESPENPERPERRESPADTADVKIAILEGALAAAMTDDALANSSTDESMSDSGPGDDTGMEVTDGDEGGAAGGISGGALAGGLRTCYRPYLRVDCNDNMSATASEDTPGGGNPVEDTMATTSEGELSAPSIPSVMVMDMDAAAPVISASSPVKDMEGDEDNDTAIITDVSDLGDKENALAPVLDDAETTSINMKSEPDVTAPSVEDQALRKESIPSVCDPSSETGSVNAVTGTCEDTETNPCPADEELAKFNSEAKIITEPKIPADDTQPTGEDEKMEKLKSEPKITPEPNEPDEDVQVAVEPETNAPERVADVIEDPPEKKPSKMDSVKGLFCGCCGSKK